MVHITEREMSERLAKAKQKLEPHRDLMERHWGPTFENNPFYKQALYQLASSDDRVASNVLHDYITG